MVLLDTPLPEPVSPITLQFKGKCPTPSRKLSSWIRTQKRDKALVWVACLGRCDYLGGKWRTQLLEVAHVWISSSLPSFWKQRDYLEPSQDPGPAPLKTPAIGVHNQEGLSHDARMDCRLGGVTAASEPESM